MIIGLITKNNRCLNYSCVPSLLSTGILNKGRLRSKNVECSPYWGQQSFSLRERYKALENYCYIRKSVRKVIAFPGRRGTVGIVGGEGREVRSVVVKESTK